MPFGDSGEQRPGLCFRCLKPMQGSVKGLVGGVGFGSVKSDGMIPVCINPACSEGQKTLAPRSQEAAANS